MRRTQSLPSRIELRSRSLALGLATSALGACTRTPAPPAACGPIEVAADLASSLPLARQTNLDSLGGLIGRTGDDGARAHLVQEYVFAANRLAPPARRAALASVAAMLEQAGRR